MAEQQAFVPFSESKTPEERTKWVDEQRALGNPKILPKGEWYKKNEVKIRISNLEQEVKSLKDIFLKFNKSK
jgi:hypothetical protein